MRRVVTGAASPKQATKASPRKPNRSSVAKSKPLAAAWVVKDTQGSGGEPGGSAITGSRPSTAVTPVGIVESPTGGIVREAVPGSLGDLVEVVWIADDEPGAALVDAVLGGESRPSGWWRRPKALRSPHARSSRLLPSGSQRSTPADVVEAVARLRRTAVDGEARRRLQLIAQLVGQHVQPAGALGGVLGGKALPQVSSGLQLEVGLGIGQAPVRAGDRPQDPDGAEAVYGRVLDVQHHEVAVGMVDEANTKRR